LWDSLSWHDEEEPLQVIRRDLVEDDFNVDVGLKSHREEPDGTAEYQVVHLLVLLQLCRHVKNVLFTLQRHRKRVTLHDTVDTEFRLLGRTRWDVQRGRQLVDYVLRIFIIFNGCHGD
jgi:hypothetical protein